MESEERFLANRDVKEIEISVPRGHQHLRTTLMLKDGSSIVLQEATVANLVRAYISIKTHPQKERVRLVGEELSPGDKKESFASWQLLEDDTSTDR